MVDKRNRRVAIIGTRGYPSYYGGFETAVRNLAPDLVDRGWDVVVYCRSGQVAEVSNGEQVRQAFTPALPSTSLSTLSHGLTSAMHAIFKERPDVVLMMNVANGYWIPLLRVAGIPVAINVDGIEWHRAKWNRLGKLIFKVGAWLSAKFANELIVDAHAIGDYWKDKFGADSNFIPYGARPDHDPVDLSKHISFSEYVLIVARFVPENSIQQIINVARELNDEIPFVFVGSGSLEFESQLEDLASRAPNVRWLGHISDDDYLFSLWENSTVYFHGHTVGGTNPALVQAMHLGAATVARDTVFNREVLGDAAIFVSDEMNALVEAIREMRTNIARREQIARDAQKRAQENYTWPLVNEAYARVLERQISARTI